MKHKTWFRLVIKAIGVLLIGLSLRTAWALGVELVVLLWAYVFGTDLSPNPYSYSGYGYGALRWIQSGGEILQLGLGLYLFFGGKWIIDKAIPSNRPYCPECGYDISKSGGPNCPECGMALPARHSATLPP